MTARGAALTGDELSAYFQPIFRLGDGAVFGVEVLARRAINEQHQPPALFFHLLGSSRGWLRVDLSSLRHALRIAGLLPRHSPYHLFVNLSVATAFDSRWLPMYLSVLAWTAKQLGPHRLVVEIPEEYEGSPLQVAELCFRLRQTGVLVALDDHRGVAADARREGSWLWDIVKIDTGDRHVGDAAATLNTILTRRRAAHLDQPLIILEGIEQAESVHQFIPCGVPLLIQGYAFCRPVPLEDALAVAEAGAGTGAIPLT